LERERLGVEWQIKDTRTGEGMKEGRRGGGEEGRKGGREEGNLLGVR